MMQLVGNHSSNGVALLLDPRETSIFEGPTAECIRSELVRVLERTSFPPLESRHPWTTLMDHDCAGWQRHSMRRCRDPFQAWRITLKLEKILVIGRAVE